MGFLTDHDNKLSSMRLVWSLSILIILIVWGGVSIHNWELAHLTVGDAAAFGMLFGSKPAADWVASQKSKGGS